MMPEKSTLAGCAAAYGAVLIWSASYTVKAPLLQYLSATEVVFLQYLFAIPLLGLLAVRQGARMRIPLRRAAGFLCSGMLGIALYQVLVNTGIGMVGSVLATVFSGLIPSMCLVPELLLFHKKATRAQIVSILASVLGIFLAVGGVNLDPASLPGCLILLVSNAFWIFFCYFNSRIQGAATVQGTLLLFYQALGAELILLPILVLQGDPLWDGLARVDVLGGLLFLAVVNGVAAYLLLQFALRRINVLSYNLINNLIPVITAVLDYLLWGRAISVVQMCGILLIIFSVVALSRDRAV